ncbi:MAG: glycosyl transferase [Cyclobacteriaceae bacterium]|nr:MAG: glycosyl transferase [Cyclobacteriaceae bacterium]
MGKTKVLVAVLNWGLGHATRSIPVIGELLNQNCEVILASDGQALDLLRQEFPGLHAVEFPSYNIRYAATARTLPFVLAARVPQLLRAITAESKYTASLVQQENIRLIISDNRYGVFHPAVHSVWLGHQLHLLMPHGWKWLSRLINQVHRRYLGRFNSYWVPDLPGSVLSGEMSRAGFPNRYVGLLSRFNIQVPPPEKPYQVVAVLSGPEPQRSLLESGLRRQFEQNRLHTLLVRGIGTGSHIVACNGFDVVDFLPAGQLNAYMLHAGLVVARSGYSTVMDLCRLNRKALLIPTPGQPEQEYLAQKLAGTGCVMVQHQNRLNLAEAWQRRHELVPFNIPDHHNQLLAQAVRTALGTVG